MKKDFFGDKLMEPTPLVEQDGTITNQKGDIHNCSSIR